MSNKTSDENVATEEDVLGAFVLSNRIEAISQEEFEDVKKAIKNILAEREQMLQRYEERDNELWERVKQCNNLQTEIDRLYQENEKLIEINRKQANRKKELEEEHKNVLDLIFEYGQTDGEHHKMWVIDQIVRMLTKDKYNEWIKDYVYDEETGDTYSWDKGIAP